MLNRRFLLSAFFLSTASLFAETIEANLKNIEHSLSFKFVDISKTDVNRIICKNGEIGNIIYSKDKEFTIQKDGINAFIKLSPVTTRANGVIIESLVNDFTRDVYIECNKNIYSLNLVPKDITAQTIVLFDNGPIKENIEAKRFEQSNSFEKTIIDILKSIYKDNEPDGYIAKLLKPKTIKFDELELTPTKTYTGNDYIANEYKIQALKDIELEEKMFLSFVSSNALALSLTELNLNKGEEARLFVISNSTPDPMTIEQKTQNYFNSLGELQKLEDANKKTTTNDITDFVENKIKVEDVVKEEIILK